MRRRLFHIVNAALAVGFWLFYGLKCSGMMHGIEGDSLFVWTPQFASEMLSRSGGLSGWLCAFFTQFYYYPLLGSALAALLLALLSLGVSLFCRSGQTLPLALVPSMVCAALLLDPKWTLALPVALCISVWVALGVCRIRPMWLKIAAAAGAAMLLWFKVIDCQYYIYAESPVLTYAAIVAGTALVCVVCALVPQKGPRWIGWAGYAVLAAAFLLVAPGRVDDEEETVARYSYMVRVRDWDAVIAKASKEKLRSPLCANALNLALEMKGQLGEDMFRFYQNGQRSLVNFEERKLSSEILYLLGFVNEARHLAFEDMAGNPSRDRGAYHLTRLVNFNAVDPQRRPIADRYLGTLHKTLFYRHFEPENLVSSEMEPCEDFFFNFDSFSQMLGFLHNQRPDNLRARDYFAASLLLDKQTSIFAAFFPPSEDNPKSWREALQVASSLAGGEVAPELQAYVDAYNANHGRSGGMSRFSGTYWYYFNFR